MTLFHTFYYNKSTILVKTLFYFCNDVFYKIPILLLKYHVFTLNSNSILLTKKKCIFLKILHEFFFTLTLILHCTNWSMIFLFLSSSNFWWDQNMDLEYRVLLFSSSHMLCLIFKASFDFMPSSFQPQIIAEDRCKHLILNLCFVLTLTWLWSQTQTLYKWGPW